METNFQNKILAVSFISAPLLMLISDVLKLLLPEDYFWFNSIIFWFSFYAFIGVIIGMVKLSNNTTFSNISAMLAIFGTLIGITIIGSERAAGSMLIHQIDIEVIKQILSEPILFFTSRMPGILFPIGLIMLSIAMKKAGSLSLPNTLILILGILLFPVGRIPKVVGINVISDFLMLIIFVQIGMNLLNRHKLINKKNND
ncbi:MAG: hypothetical protein K8F36_16095 [Melioribacteraceae bacterium]|nr:hypothetical protein [Melioribacteraceae bacterium]MDD3559682.1 hypothetical protein [Melioribacteraceae bacterium]